MKILNIIFLTMIYMIEPYFWIKSMSTMKHRFEEKKYYIAAFLGYYILTLLKQYTAFSGKSDFVTILFETIIIAYLFLVPIFYFEEPFYRKIMNVGIFSCCVFLTESLPILGVMFLFDLSMNDVGNFGWINSICTLVAKCMLGVVCYFFFFQGAKRLVIRLYGNKEIIPLILINFLLEMPSFSMIHNTSFHDNKEIYLLFLFVQFVLIGNTVYIIHILRRQINKMSDMEEELNKSKQIIELSSKLSDLKHDISFHVNIMKNLADTKNYEELVKYINTAFADVETAKKIFTLSDKPLSATLNVLATEAAEKGIDFRHIILVDNFIMPSHEICSLMSNVVKNAIEAVEKLEKEERVICLEIAPDEGGYYISCINPYKKRPKMEQGIFTTSKMDSANHGRGIRIIRKIAEKNNGIAKFEIHDTCFEFYCYIPDRDNGKEEGY